jgi:hypothetical protein
LKIPFLSKNCKKKDEYAMALNTYKVYPRRIRLFRREGHHVDQTGKLETCHGLGDRDCVVSLKCSPRARPLAPSSAFFLSACNRTLIYYQLHGHIYFTLTFGLPGEKSRS